jgi:hypothetical protein
MLIWIHALIVQDMTQTPTQGSISYMSILASFYIITTAQVAPRPPPSVEKRKKKERKKGTIFVRNGVDMLTQAHIDMYLLERIYYIGVVYMYK